jgi:hypothetical protein
MTKKIGRFEKISISELNIKDVDAKIDTGAFNIALHVDGFEVVDNKLYFWIGDSEKICFDQYKEITVKSSFGRIQKRYLIKTKMKLGKKVHKVYVSLTNRKNMKFPCLIGRRFLYKYNYLVDVREKNLHDRTKKI